MVIKYIAFFDVDAQHSSRNISPAAVNKVSYIIDSFNRVGRDVEVISPTWKIAQKNPLHKDAAPKSFKLIFPPENTYFGLFSGVFNLVRINLWLVYYLCSRLKRKEKLLVYHSLAIIPAVFIAKVLMSLKITLEVEELYTSVGTWSSALKAIERTYVWSIGCSYILSTELLEKFIPSQKSRILLYGVYLMNRQAKGQRMSPGTTIKLLYAGIIDREKKGAFNALNAAELLDHRYELRIIGFGDVDELVQEIGRINRRRDGCKVFYDGHLSGQDFEDYCSDFDVGLSTQTSSGAYLQSSFPSKILSYLNFGMKVVSPRIDCVVESAVGRLVNYYENDDPENIAECIRGIDFSEGLDGSAELERLDIEFRSNLKAVFVDGC